MKEALKLALEALELAHPRFGIATEKHKQAITAIKAALAQEQEPVAWMTISPFGDEDDIWYANPEGQLREGWTYKALYEEPPKQNPLTSIDYVPCCTDQTCPKCKAATPPQPEERNFCPRCGKRTADLTVIHTCTPPQENT